MATSREPVVLVPVTGVQSAAVVGQVNVWGPVNTTQTPSWTVVSTTQSSTWVDPQTS